MSAPDAYHHPSPTRSANRCSPTTALRLWTESDPPVADPPACWCARPPAGFGYRLLTDWAGRELPADPPR